jgi:hypothetical protein
MIQNDETVNLEDAQPPAGSYRRLSVSNFEVEQRDRIAAVFKLMCNLHQVARSLGDDQLVRWATEVRANIASDTALMLTKLGWTMKTHKAILSCKLLHLSSKHTFDALSRLLKGILTTHLTCLQHITYSTEDVLKLLGAMK